MICVGPGVISCAARFDFHLRGVGLYPVPYILNLLPVQELSPAKTLHPCTIHPAPCLLYTAPYLYNMKVFSAEQIRRWDEATIKEKEISSHELMERAALACVNWLLENNCLNKNIHIFCGPGNNGGDGFAIARLLLKAGVKTNIYTTKGKPTALNQLNRELLEKICPVKSIEGKLSLPPLDASDLVIEAIFGTGLKRKPREETALLIDHINQAGCTVVSIDIPGGLFTDLPTEDGAITATHTLTFQSPKIAFFFPESEKYLGSVHVLDIGLSPGFYQAEPARFHLTEANEISTLVRKRKSFSHKGDYGHAAIVAGSKGMMGAAVLAAKGCLYAGAGKLTCIVPPEGINIVQSAVPAAMARTRTGAFIKVADKFAAIGLGPGLGRKKKEEKELLEKVFSAGTPLVIDADALNALAEHRKMLKSVPEDSILTPHPGEFDRLFGTVSNRAEAAIEAAVKYHVYIVVKGKFTCIATPDGHGYFNPTGNPGMARGGMGDVLTGIITGLRSQGYSALHSCLLGVYIHGLAADLAVEDFSMQALQPENLIEYLGKAWKLICSSA